jgi:hypothetical protein
MKAVQELLGHQSFEMTMRYAHLSPEVGRQVVQLLDPPLRALGVSPKHPEQGARRPMASATPQRRPDATPIARRHGQQSETDVRLVPPRPGPPSGPWVSLVHAADMLDEPLESLRKKVLRAARGAGRATISGVDFAKFGRSWKAKLGEWR